MNLYIKLEDGAPVDHPYLEDNLKEAWQVGEITESLLAEKGFARFENTVAPIGSEVTEVNGYELHPDGVVRTKVVVRELTQEEKVTLWIRRHRDFLLAQSDWTQMADAPLTDKKKAEWAKYRQALRDMPSQYTDIQDPGEIVPPTPPKK